MLGKLLGVVRKGVPLQDQAFFRMHEAKSAHSACHPGQPADEILRLARKVSCDLIVMGTHGRTGLARLLHGSVAEEVLRKATCPVLTVHLPAPHSQTS